MIRPRMGDRIILHMLLTCNEYNTDLIWYMSNHWIISIIFWDACRLIRCTFLPIKAFLLKVRAHREYHGDYTSSQHSSFQIPVYACCNERWIMEFYNPKEKGRFFLTLSLPNIWVYAEFGSILHGAFNYLTKEACSSSICQYLVIQRCIRDPNLLH